jgi:NADH dehydrogenase
MNGRDADQDVGRVSNGGDQLSDDHSLRGRGPLDGSRYVAYRDRRDPYRFEDRGRTSNPVESGPSVGAPDRSHPRRARDEAESHRLTARNVASLFIVCAVYDDGMTLVKELDEAGYVELEFVRTLNMATRGEAGQGTDQMSRARTLTSSMFIARPVEEVFAFFERPDNLARITPPELGFQIRSSDRVMRADLTIDYTVRPFLGVPTSWRTRIDAYHPPASFVDIQERGPYRRWEHLHSFTAVEGGTRVDDSITYELPLGVLGDRFHDRLIRPALERIFTYRSAAIAEHFQVPVSNQASRCIAVAGGSGFVGGAIAAELHRRGERVVILSHREAELARGPLPDSVQVRQADVTSSVSLRDALSGVDALVISLAFRNSPMEKPGRGRTFMDVDAAGTERLVAAAAEAGVGRLVYLSGAGAAPDAKRVWFRAKARAEAAVRASGLPFTIIRPTWIYGPRDAALNRFIGFARALPVVPLTNLGRQPMAPVFIDDVAKLAADSLVQESARDQVFEIGGPETMPMKEVVRRALTTAGVSRTIMPGPAPLLKLMAIPLSWLPNPLLTPSAVDFINQPATVDVTALLEHMPRRLTPLDEGLATYLRAPAGLRWQGG